MDEKIIGIIDILADYDRVLHSAVQLVDHMWDDHALSTDTMSLMEGVMVSAMLDKAAPYIPDSEDQQQAVMSQADRLGEVTGRMPSPLPLIYQVALGYAIALSQSRNGWRPWERVRDYILEEFPENCKDDTGTIDNQ